MRGPINLVAPHILVLGSGWVGTYCAQRFREELGARVTVTTTTPEKRERFLDLGLPAFLVDFDKGGSEVPPDELAITVFDILIISVPITRKDDLGTIQRRFKRLVTHLSRLRFKQAVFFGSVGVYPNVDALIHEDTFPDTALDQRLRYGETVLQKAFPDTNILRLGGLFGANRIFAKYFQGKVCTIGSQTANFVHVEDIYHILLALMDKEIVGATYNVVCPENPLKKEVIEASAAKYGFELPSRYDDTDQTAKHVSCQRLLDELHYSFIYPSPIYF